MQQAARHRRLSPCGRRTACSSSLLLCPPHQPQCNARQPYFRKQLTACQASQVHLILYTKPDCPLCDGLKDKVQALIDRADFLPCFLTGASLTVRDISTNEVWQDAMHLSVPVLAVLDTQQQEVVLPRPQPRVSADRLQQHLELAVQAAGVDVGGEGTQPSDASEQPYRVLS